MRLRFVNRGAHVLIILVRFAINKKRIFPVLATAGAFVDVTQVNATIPKYGEYVNQSARFMRRDEHQSGFVIA